jgi:hypothetical protein
LSNLRLFFEVVSGNYPKMVADEQKRIATAATGAMRDAAALIKRNGRASIGSAGFSNRWQNAWRGKSFPANGVSLKPAAIAYHKIPYAGVFEQGATISGKPLLWIPLPNVPMGNGGRRMTPQTFVKTIGPLYSIRSGGKPMLAAVIKATDARAAKSLSLALLRRGRNPKGRGKVWLVPLYVGVSAVSDPKKFNLKAVVQDAADQLGALYAANFKE